MRIRTQVCRICRASFKTHGGWGRITQYCTDCRQSRWREMRAANRVLQRAIKSGQVIRISKANATCVDCGTVAQAWEHRDYREPLKVDPVCHGCNHRRGPGMTAHEASFVETRRMAS